MNKAKIYGLLISASLVVGIISIPTTTVYAQNLASKTPSKVITTAIDLSSNKTENLTINFNNFFNWNPVNVTVVINGVKYNEVYGYSGSITIKNVPKTSDGINDIEIEIPMFNTITLNTSSTNISITPVATLMTFNGNKVLKDAVANAIGANPNDLTYYDVSSYCYAAESGFVPKLSINLSNKDLTTLQGIQELRGFDISSLNLSNNDISDLSLLEGLTINNLNISNNDITNLSPVSEINGLSVLNANYNYISSVTCLKGIASLTDVTLENNLLSTNPLSLDINGLNTSGLSDNFILGLQNQLQIKLNKSTYSGTVGSIVPITDSDIQVTNGTLGINETDYYKKYLILTSSNLQNLIPESTGFKIQSTGTNSIIASVDGIDNNLGETTATIHSSQSTKTENLTINFSNMFDVESYLPSINIDVIINGKTYNEIYNYSGSLTINNVSLNATGTNNIKIEIPEFNTITLNTSSNDITVNPVQEIINFDGNKALINAVSNAIQVNPSELTYYNLESYCYAEENGFGTPLDINLSGKELTNLDGIEELKGFDINSLDLSNNKLTNLTALEGLTINDLNVSHNNITSVTPLTKVSGLQSLNISYNNIMSTKALSDINGLTNIISNNN
ncbi:MAG: hypothetical protein Q4B63_06420 [Clostridium perfringens]|nr:hypothetical protein [Clostridium perfringens]